MDTWQVEFGCLARDDVFNILYKARFAKSSEEVERDTLWSLRKRKGWIVGNKHGTNGSAAWNISNPFHLIFLTLTCQQWSCKKSENASWCLPISHGTPFPSFPPKKHRKSCQTAFPSVVFLLFLFRFHQLPHGRFLQTTLVNNPSQAVGLCKCFHLGVRMDVVDLSFQWAKLPGNVIPMEVPWIYTNLH